MFDMPAEWIRTAAVGKVPAVNEPVEDADFEKQADAVSAVSKGLNAEKQKQMLLQLEFPLLDPAGAEPAVVGDKPMAVVMPVNLGLEIAQGMAPVLRQFQGALGALSASIKKSKRKEADDSSDDEELDGKQRLKKLCQFGELQHHKKKRMILADLHCENEVEKFGLRSAFARMVALASSSCCGIKGWKSRPPCCCS
jgi:hypothetical protein